MKQLKKTLLTLVALLAVTTGAWADETPLLTINASSEFTMGSKTFDNKVTVTFSNFVYYDGEEGWYADGDPSLLTVAGTNGYTITSCKFYTANGEAETGYTIEGKSPSVYLSASTEVYTDANQSVYLGYQGITKIEVYGTAPSASSGPEVAWDMAKNTGSFNMPGGNVTLEPEYYPQAALAAAPTAINDVPATTDGAIVKAGTVANIGSTETAQGTVMYYVSQTALDDAALLALAADQWTADVPTAADLAQGQAYVYYYVRGNDSDTDAENFSDGDIKAANKLEVTIAPEPTYAVTFAEGVNPEPPAQPEWTASPNAGVKKGQTVTVTYTGSKKVIGVKAEKKAATVPVNAITLNKTATTITAGQTETLSVSSVTPDDATDQTVTWSSDNEAVATVDADGKVTAVALGTANITATANDGSGVTATCAVTVNKVVTINQSDWGGWDTPITKDGVTVSASMIDPNDGNLIDGGTFSTTLGNFTKIVVTTAACDASGTGWSGNSSSKTWAGTPASTVSFSGDFMGMGMTQTTIVCTIVPKN